MKLSKDSENKSVLVFGFGSNCNLVELQKNLRHSVDLVSPAWCPGHEPAYRYYSSTRNGGALDMRAVSDSTMVTAGAVLRMSRDARDELDRKEGVPNCYERRMETVLTPKGEFLEVETYTVNPSAYSQSHEEPSSEYSTVVENGMLSLGHKVDQFTQAALDQTVESPINKVFVYGTLKGGQSREMFLSEFSDAIRQSARTQGQLFDLGAYPGMLVSDKGDEWVTGELVTVSDVSSALQMLDEIEGFTGFKSRNNLFERRLVTVTLGNGSTEIAWVYLYAGDVSDSSVIVDGCWGDSPEPGSEEVDLYTDRPNVQSDACRWSIEDCLSSVSSMRLQLERLSGGVMSASQAVRYATQLIERQRLGDKGSPFYGAWRVVPGNDGMPADVRVDFVYTPTYLAVAFLCRFSLEFPKATSEIPDLAAVIEQGISFAIGRNLQGAGYARTSGLLRALEIMKRGRVVEYIEIYNGTAAMQLSTLIENAANDFQRQICLGETESVWGGYDTAGPMYGLFRLSV